MFGLGGGETASQNFEGVDFFRNIYWHQRSLITLGLHSGPNREIKEKCVETGETAFQNSSMKTFKEIFVNIFENICWQFEIYLLTFWEIFVDILRNMCWHQRSVGTVRGKRLAPTNLAWKLFVRKRTWRKIYEQTDGSQPRGQTASLKSDNLSHKKENGEVWFKFYFWQVWSALLALSGFFKTTSNAALWSPLFKIFVAFFFETTNEGPLQCHWTYFLTSSGLNRTKYMLIFY